jgi:HTH-type transcriptional regulator/antitoxin HigA
MATNINSSDSYYLELIRAFPLRPITNEDELIATQNRIDLISNKKQLTQDDRDYLAVLGLLLHDYEERNEKDWMKLAETGFKDWNDEEEDIYSK